MDDLESHIRLSAITVDWSSAEGVYVARSAHYPQISYGDRWSSLAAVDGLIDTIRQLHLAGQLTDSSAAARTAVV